MGEGQASELGLSSAGAAIMGKLPPAHFCSTVVRLLALQVRALGVTPYPSLKYREYKKQKEVKL
jgi:hypothetical protein